MGKKRLTNQYLVTNVLTGVTKEIYQDLVNGDSDKEIANRYNVTRDIVMRIKKNFTAEIRDSKNLRKEVAEAEAEDSTDESVVSTAESAATNEAVVIKHKQGKRISDEQKLEIAEMLEAGLDPNQVAERTGVSSKSVRKIGTEFGVYTPRNRKQNKEVDTNTTEEAEEAELHSTKEAATKSLDVTEVQPWWNNKTQNEYSSSKELVDMIMRYTDNSFRAIKKVRKEVKVGLCRDRHPMNVNDFIFDIVGPELMFDYDKQETLVEQWLIDNIDRDAKGLPIQSLTVYTTGLNCINASVIKACNKAEINLTLMQYDSRMRTYHPQVMFESFEMSEMSEPSSIDSMLAECNCKLYRMKSPQEVNDEEFFVYETYAKGDTEEKAYFIINDEDAAWTYLRDVVETLKEKKNKCSLFFDKYTKDKKGTYNKTNLCKSFNY